MRRARRILDGHRVGSDRIALVFALLVVLSAASVLGAVRVDLDALPVDFPERHRTWLLEVELLLGEDELEQFLALARDYQRDAFIERFWRERDPDPRTGRNEARDDWHARIAAYRQQWGDDLRDVRAKPVLLHGLPDGHWSVYCPGITWPIEVFYYERTELTSEEFALIFFRPWGVGAWRFWDPWEGTGKLFQSHSAGGAASDYCNIDALYAALDLINRIRAQAPTGFPYEKLVARHEEPPTPPNNEWVLTFAAYSTEVPTGIGVFDAEIDFAFPGFRQSRTAVQGHIRVDGAEVEPVELAGASRYAFLLNGEVLRDGELFDAFRYRFELGADEQGSLPLVFQRFLRPGSYQLILRLEDLGSRRMMRWARELEVPVVTSDVRVDAESVDIFASANAQLAAGEVGIELLAPIGELLTGLQRFVAVPSGERIDHVVFALDGQAILTKRQAPYSVELDLGDLPRTVVLRASAFDREGVEIASDELMLNASPHRFTVRLIEPVAGRAYRGSVRVRADVHVPRGASLAEVAIYRDEERLAVLEQPPFSHPVDLPRDGALSLIRVEGRLTDGRRAEHAVLVNAPDQVEEIDVDFVELYVKVSDRDKRPVIDLPGDVFTVLEDGVPQSVRRFEHVRDLPIWVTVLLDVSASMRDRLTPASGAALGFVQSLSERDRAALLTFNDHAEVVVPFSRDSESFARGLSWLAAERGTALWDALVRALTYQQGLEGQRAVVLLSDGEDENSRFEADHALDHARRAGVAVYAIGLDLPRGPARRTLQRIANETGGRLFLVNDPAALAAVYAEIGEELRSKYLLAYQSTGEGDGFREIEVRVDGRGLEATAVRGYFP
ncbi:MAG: VWA domain-containing protein [Acidobacteriota bacterium]